MSKSGRFLSNIAAIALIWLFLAGIALLTLWPSVPSSWAGWALLAVFGPPLYLLGEYISDKLWSDESDDA